VKKHCIYNTALVFILIGFSTSLFCFSIPSKIKKRIERINRHKYYIFIEKTKFKLHLLKENHDLIKTYDIAIGAKKNFARKTHAGDKGTPEGLYYITDILGYHFPQDDRRYQGMKNMNQKYFKHEHGYHKWGFPNKDLGKNAYGPRFFRLGYPNSADQARFKKLKKENKISKNADIGSGLAIHGTNDPNSIGHCATTGCVRMRNQDLIEITDYIKIGTVVFIKH
jgi:murein L,D-transpeptidase YafK